MGNRVIKPILFIIQIVIRSISRILKFWSNQKVFVVSV